ncbi:MAG: response regulator [Geobacter sp.]|nr:response regulator [Geobacter sp.]
MNYPSKTSKPAVKLEPHILVVDDEPEIRKVVMLYLQQCGFRVSNAESAENGYQLLKKERFDVVVTDVMMPGEDGISFLSKVQQSHPEIPVILMTAYAELQMALEAIKNGAYEFIQKPFDFDILRKVVDKAVNYSKLQHAEKGERVELEKMLAARTAELENARVQLDLAHAKILKSVTRNSETGNIAHREQDSSDTISKIFSRIV